LAIQKPQQELPVPEEKKDKKKLKKAAKESPANGMP